MIPDDDVQHSDGDHRATKQPVVPVQIVPQPNPDISFPGGPGGVLLHQTPPSRGTPVRNDPDCDIFVST